MNRRTVDNRRGAWIRTAALGTMLAVLATGASAAQATTMQDAGFRKGTVFFAPMNDAKRHEIVAGMNTVTGTEVYTTWGEIEKEEGVYDWSSIDAIRDRYKAEGKKIAIRIATASFSINDTPAYVFTKYDVRRIAEGVEGSWMSFENGLKDYVLGPAGRLTDAAGRVVAGTSSLRASGNGVALKAGSSMEFSDKDGYSLQFDYRLSADSTYYVRIVDAKGGVEEKVFTGKAGDEGARTVEFDVVPERTPYTFSVGVRGGDLSIDNVNVCERKTAWFVGTLCFPDYLDPTFETLYERFVAAFADKYGDDPDVSAVCVGGYGRWEEITLCDDADLDRFEDQWPSRGFTNRKYIDHIRWCIDTYKRHFPQKALFLCAIGFPGADAFRDQNLIDWTITGYAAKNGVGIKYNGWQHMSDEWTSPMQAIFYQMNRYRNDPSVTTVFEEGGQVSGGLSEVMGHPLSLLNKAILNRVDYYWIYSDDILDPFVTRYLHYAGESAGSALVTQLYALFGRTQYYSLKSSIVYDLYNQHMGIFQTDTKVKPTQGGFRADPDVEFTTVAGVPCLRTRAGASTVSFSLDDRQKYNGMYGAFLTIDYLDEGTDAFDVYGYSSKGEVLLGTVRKTGSGAWRSVSLRDPDLFNTVRNGRAKDMSREIQIDDLGDGVETLRAIHVDFVPARDFREEVAAAAEPTGGKRAIDGEVTFEVPGQGALSGIAVPIGPDVDADYVNVKADVAAVVGGQTVAAGSKEWFMPQEGDWLYVPIARTPRAERYVVTLTCDAGAAHVLTAADGKPAWRAYRFSGQTAGETTKAAEPGRATFEAPSPFASLRLDGTGLEGARAVLARRMPGGAWETGIASGTVATAGEGTFVLDVEPQPAGLYEVRLESGEGTVSSVAPTLLARVQASNPATRYLLGLPDPAFVELMKDESASFRPVSGFAGAAVEDGLFTARLSGENAVLETGEGFRLAADGTHAFHAVLKNATSAAFLKLWWKTEGKDYDEADTLLIPVVPNDDRYREYTWTVGDRDGWTGTLTGLRVMPAYGHADVGEVGIATLDLRRGGARTSAYAEPLDLASVDRDGTFAVEAAPTPVPTGGAKGLPTGWAVAIAALAAVVAGAWAFVLGRYLGSRRKK